MPKQTPESGHVIVSVGLSGQRVYWRHKKWIQIGGKWVVSWWTDNPNEATLLSRETATSTCKRLNFLFPSAEVDYLEK
jgi:hypothetical protein